MKSHLILIGLLISMVNLGAQSTPDLEIEKLKWQQQYKQYEQDAIKSAEEATRRIEQKAKDLEETIKKGQDEDQAYQSTKELFPTATKEMEKPYQSSDGAPRQFDPVKENLDRFTNSPCYSELGFIPGRDNEQLYRDCERRKGSFGHNSATGNAMGYLYALGGLAGIILFLFILNHFQKRGGK